MSAGVRGRRSRAARYRRMASHVRGALTSTGYWYTPQRVGLHFQPDRIEGYFSDLRHKTEWTGRVDGRGLPLNEGADGDAVHFPITVFQKALGHWDRWLASGRSDQSHLDAVLATARWALEAQRPDGGWTCWPPLGMRMDSPCSAMAQGEGVSLLVRAHAASGRGELMDAARRAARLMLSPVEAGGTSWRGPHGLVLEEYPRLRPVTVLNGWIFALFGLHELVLAAGDDEARDALASTLEALVATLPRFDRGYWSNYDTAGNVALPFYHDLHVEQLKAVEAAFPGHAAAFGAQRGRFEAQRRGPLNPMRAIAAKAWQKLVSPPEVVLR